MLITYQDSDQIVRQAQPAEALAGHRIRGDDRVVRLFGQPTGDRRVTQGVLGSIDMSRSRALSNRNVAPE